MSTPPEPFADVLARCENPQNWVGIAPWRDPIIKEADLRHLVERVKELTASRDKWREVANEFASGVASWRASHPWMGVTAEKTHAALVKQEGGT